MHGPGSESDCYLFREHIPSFGDKVLRCVLLHRRSKNMMCLYVRICKEVEMKPDTINFRTRFQTFLVRTILTEYAGETFPSLQQISPSTHT
jgi:hypothetical protein